MKNAAKDFKIIFKNMNKVSKYAMKYGTALIITLAVFAVYFFIKSKLSPSPYEDIVMYTDLLYSIKECIGGVYVLPMIAEIILIASGRTKYTY